MANIYTKLPPAHNHDQVYAKIGEGGVTDHGLLTGLEDNDHPQYLLTTGKAVDSDKLDNIDSTGFVQTSGNQTVAGIKTFSSIPVLPSTDPTNANQAVRKGYADATYVPLSYNDGWIPVSDTWTYVSATSFKITGKDVRYRFPKGTKIKLVQSSTTKYFYVVATSYTSGNTIVTVTGGSDYSLAASTISGQAYSYAAAPQNFPQWLNYTPVWSADGGTPVLGNGTLFGKFSMIGANIRYLGELRLGSTTSVGTTTNWKFSLPISLVDDYRYLGQAFIRDLGVATYMRTINLEKNTDADNIILFLQMDSGTNKTRISYNDPFAFGNGDIIAWDIWYAI